MPVWYFSFLIINKFQKHFGKTMPVPDGAESLASATEETTLTQILRNNPEYSFKLREAQTIILNNRAITPPEDTPYQRQFVRRRSRSRLPYRPRQRQQKEAVPQQLDAIENSSPVVDTQQIESIPRYGSAGTDFSSENSVDDTLENQIKRQFFLSVSNGKNIFQ